MRKSLNELFRKSAAVAVLSGGVMAFMLAAAGQAPAADISGDGVFYDDQAVIACGQDTSNITLYDAQDRPTIPARTEFFTCITGTTLVREKIPPPPEYCCH